MLWCVFGASSMKYSFMLRNVVDEFLVIMNACRVFYSSSSAKQKEETSIGLKKEIKQFNTNLFLRISTLKLNVPKDYSFRKIYVTFIPKKQWFLTKKLKLRNYFQGAVMFEKLFLGRQRPLRRLPTSRE